MRTLWPWIVMGAGVIGLFVYRFLITKRRLPFSADYGYAWQYRHGADERTRDATRRSGVRNLESRPKEGTFHAKRLHILSYPQTIMPVLISAAVLCSALYVVLSKDAYPDAHQKWAFGAVGTILGYWFKK